MAIVQPGIAGERDAKKDLAEEARANSRSAGFALLAAGLLMLLGSVMDFAILWILQRQPDPQWEFVATVNTLEGFPRLVLGAALILASFWVRGDVTRWKYKAFSGFILFMGIVSALLGVILITSFFPLSNTMNTNPNAIAILKSVALKGLMLSSLYFVVLLPTGLLSLRRTRS